MKHNLTPKQEEKLISQTISFRAKVLDAVEKTKNRKNITGGFRHLMLCDIREYLVYCDSILAGNYFRAYSVQSNMDTSPREAIPNSIYNTIEYKLTK